MISGESLLHPGLVRSIPMTGVFVAPALEKRAAHTMIDNPARDPNVSVVIRTRNNADRLEGLFEDLHGQIFASEIETIVVDNGSTDGTRAIARHYGASVIDVSGSRVSQLGPKNAGLVAASHDTVMMTVGNASLSSRHTLHSGARHFAADSKVAGTYGGTLPGVNASPAELWTAFSNTHELVRPAHPVRHSGMGVIATTGAMLSRKVWDELGRFDEERADADNEAILAERMLVAGCRIVREPAQAVHHSKRSSQSVKLPTQPLSWHPTLDGPKPAASLGEQLARGLGLHGRDSF